MEVKTNADNCKIGQKQARYFAIQIFSNMKDYIAKHKAEYEVWLRQEGAEDEHE